MVTKLEIRISLFHMENRKDKKRTKKPVYCAREHVCAGMLLLTIHRVGNNYLLYTT